MEKYGSNVDVERMIGAVKIKEQAEKSGKPTETAPTKPKLKQKPTHKTSVNAEGLNNDTVCAQPKRREGYVPW